MKSKRIQAGEYLVQDGDLSVTVSLRSECNGWLYAANWDRDLADVASTKHDAVSAACAMIAARKEVRS